MKKKAATWIKHTILSCMARVGAAAFAVSVLAVSIPSAVYAAEVKEVNIEGYALEENQMKIYLNSDAEEVLSENLQIFLGNTEYPVAAKEDFADSEESMTWLFLVDVSGSVKEADMQNSKEVLTQLVEKMGDNDNAMLIQIRNEITAGAFSSDKEALTGQIAALECTREDTNLYLAVREALKLLREDKSCHNKKCVVIISDGKDDQKNGILFEDVRDLIRKEHVPICTLAMPIKAGMAGEGPEPDKVMKSFTENAAGGVYLKYEEAETDNAGIAETFVQAVRSGSIVTIALEGFEPNGTAQTLTVQLASDEEMVEADSVEIPSHMIAAALPDVEEEAVEEEISEPEAEEVSAEPEEKSDGKAYIIWIAGLCLLLGGGIIFWKQKMKSDKKKSDREKSVEEQAAETADAASDTTDVANESDKATSEDKVLEAEEKAVSEQVLQVEKVTDRTAPLEVVLTKVGPGATDVYRGICDKSMLIGRSKAAAITISDDPQLSGRHCQISMEDGRMMIEDLESTNGTFLNGIPLNEKSELVQNDIIYIGSFEYRVSWD